MPLRDSYPWFATAWKFAHLHAQFADCRRVAASLRKVVRVVVLRSMHANLPDFWAGRPRVWHSMLPSSCSRLEHYHARIIAYCTGYAWPLVRQSPVCQIGRSAHDNPLNACVPTSGPALLPTVHACPRAGVMCLAPGTYECGVYRRQVADR